MQEGKKGKSLDSERQWMDWYGTGFMSVIELRHATEIIDTYSALIYKLLLAALNTLMHFQKCNNHDSEPFMHAKLSTKYIYLWLMN